VARWAAVGQRGPLLHLTAQNGVTSLGCLDPDLDLVPPVARRGDDNLLAGLAIDNDDYFVNAAGQ